MMDDSALDKYPLMSDDELPFGHKRMSHPLTPTHSLSSHLEAQNGRSLILLMGIRLALQSDRNPHASHNKTTSEQPGQRFQFAGGR